ncbi:uncharacterized protein PAC_00946 [Phialocephala subalpina]|uniref:2EXR domain-containing protein n=1 Tax=Phialocephala subalpina TaxID=576137 RepID=A0A1L7WE70_9HELO|nr:uncharacterized protein PAC_00946 [Phialocephala subalpina]
MAAEVTPTKGNHNALDDTSTTTKSKLSTAISKSIKHAKKLLVSQSQAPKPKTLKKFHLFNRLPIELRLVIWKLALPRSSTFAVFGFGNMIYQGRLHFAISLHSYRLYLDLFLAHPISRACFEAHQVYVAELPHSLPFTVERRSLSPFSFRKYRMYPRMRFGNDDAVCIALFSDLVNDEESWNALVKEEWVPRIKVLLVSIGWFFNFDWIKVLKKFKSLRVIEGLPETSLLLAMRTQAFRNSMDQAKTRVETEHIEGVVIPEIVVRAMPLVG